MVRKIMQKLTRSFPNEKNQTKTDQFGHKIKRRRQNHRESRLHQPSAAQIND